jgi:NAD(P)-dependent dehydrogenase (short-subunit alcohol dehydrogenase family)
MRFNGKCVVVLGGNAGIGLAAARQFRDEGASLALTGRNPETLASAVSDLEAIGIVSDMGIVAESEAAMTTIGDRLGGIDVLFVNAGVGGFAPVTEVTEEFWDGIHNVNLKGAFFAIQKALPLMRDGGSIVITGSIGSVCALPGNAVYAAAKAGLRALVRIFAVELLERRIRVNMVSPGPTDTEIFKRNASEQEIEGLREFFASAVPSGRMGTPDEVANAVVFLASDEAAFINGVDLYVDGGCVELKR